MIEPTLFTGLERQVHDHVTELHATVAGIRPPRRAMSPVDRTLVTRTRGAVGRMLVNLGTSVAGQPQA
jgi:hypothetical protein